MASLARAGAYLPRARKDGRRVAALDEDAFTFGATAIERALDIGAAAPASPLTVRWVGAQPSGGASALATWVGGPVELLPSGEGTRALSDALRLAAGSPMRSLVVAVQWTDPEDSRTVSAPDGPPGPEGAVAFLFGPDGGGASEPFAVAGSDVLAAAFSLRTALLRAGRAEPETWWCGATDLGADAGRLAPEPAGVLPRETLSAVSEGAYVPRPRYLENLPSRWRFVADLCRACGTTSFPSRGRCRACGRVDALDQRPLPRDNALVLATTVIGRGGQPTEFDPQVELLGAYEVVLAELAPEVRATLQVADALPGSVRIGDRVDTRLRRLYAMEGEWRYGRKAVPRTSPSA